MNDEDSVTLNYYKKRISMVTQDAGNYRNLNHALIENIKKSLALVQKNVSAQHGLYEADTPESKGLTTQCLIKSGDFLDRLGKIDSGGYELNSDLLRISNSNLESLKEVESLRGRVKTNQDDLNQSYTQLADEEYKYKSRLDNIDYEESFMLNSTKSSGFSGLGQNQNVSFGNFDVMNASVNNTQNSYGLAAKCPNNGEYEFGASRPKAMMKQKSSKVFLKPIDRSQIDTIGEF